MIHAKQIQGHDVKKTEVKNINGYGIE